MLRKDILISSINSFFMEIKTLETLSENELIELAKIRTKKWGSVLSKEYGDLMYQKSIEVLKSRKSIWGDIQLVLYDDSLPCGAIHPLRINSYTNDFSDDIFKDYNTLTGNGLYTTHLKNGNTVVCPEVYSDLKGGGRKLVTGVLNLFKGLKKNDGIERMIVYTRPFLKRFLEENPNKTKEDYVDEAIEKAKKMEEKKEREKNEREYSDPFIMHLCLGAKFIRFVENGRQSDEETMGYTAILEYPLE